jgi:excisionase family DNA binding protein
VGPLPGDDADELLSPGQVAKLVGVSAKTVSNWAREGRLTSFRTMGGHRRFRRSELEALFHASLGDGDSAP